MATFEGFDFDEAKIEDDLAHFFGSTRFNDRASYFGDSNTRWNTNGKNDQQATADDRLQVLNKIIKQLERVEKIRSMIAKERSEAHLIERLEESRQAWYNSEEYKEGIGDRFQEGGLVNEWRKSQNSKEDKVETDKFETSPSLEVLKELRSGLEKASQSQTDSTSDHTHSPPESSRELPSRHELSTRVQRQPSSTRVSRSRKGTKHLPPKKDTTEKINVTKVAEEPKGTRATKIAYDPDEDFNAYLIQYGKSAGKVEPSQVKSLSSDTRVTGNFPDQRIPIRHLLGEIKIREPTEKRPRATVHHGNKPTLPAGNLLKGSESVASKISINLKWAERAISLYYDDSEITTSPPTSPGNGASSKAAHQSRTDTLLRLEYWRGQQQGERGAPVHARHMRPLCETVSLMTTDNEVVSHPKDVVLFMPFLHWETDRKRHTFANFIDTVTTTHRNEIDNLDRDARSRAVKDRIGLKKPARFEQKEPATSRRGEANPAAKRLSDLVANILNLPLPIDGNRRVQVRVPNDANDEKKSQSKLRRYLSKTAQVISGKPEDAVKPKDNQNRLGQYLIDAARLYEGIENYRDKKLLHKYLHIDPPIHPRRTLVSSTYDILTHSPLFTRYTLSEDSNHGWVQDQAYYWSLNTTQSRDRDQVVYRRTRAAVEDLHQFDMEKQNWPKHEEENEAWRFKHNDGGPCQECRANIRKVSRLIMVDQLWLWVLDEHTILTFFPRRYGTNKADVTGIHKSIRTKLEGLSKLRHPEQQMGSVWDLALVIFDECTNTFFDRTKTPNRQPQIIDDFSEAIGNVTNKQTVAFDRLWAWTEHWKDNIKKKNKSRMIELQVSLLDINPEGKLQREIKDIIEELEIMIHINRTHKTVLNSLIHQVTHIMGPKAKLRNQFSKSSDRVDETDYDRFESKAGELLSKCKAILHPNLLGDLNSADGILTSQIKDLLALKQQQASVVQAWQAAQQTEETVAQGRSIMMFTVVTIVFAPLSFMTSVFGMNAMEFSSENSWHILDEFKFILPVSAATILMVLFLAFNPYVRALVKAAHYRISAKLLTKQAWGGHSLYKVWYANSNWRGEEQIDKAHTYARKKKEAAQKEVSKEHRERQAAREEERREKSLQANGNSGAQNVHSDVERNDEGREVPSLAAEANGTRQDDEGAGKGVQVSESQGACGGKHCGVG
ncbi:Magnesium transport protein CorA- transmembrane region [Apiospora arundinis]